MSYDVRGIANFVLEVAHDSAVGITNLSMNKIVYFLHGWYLAKTGKPLVSAKIEAWEYGPVFRELYREFKCYGDKPISAYAKKVDLFTGKQEACRYEFDQETEDFLKSLVHQYIHIEPFRLVAMSHEAGGPWDAVWNSENKTFPGMRISDDLIKQHFGNKSRH